MSGKMNYNDFNKALGKLMRNANDFAKKSVAAISKTDEADTGVNVANEKCEFGRTGFLSVWVTTANRAFAVEGAKITIYDRVGNAISTQYTDATGKIERVALCTPPKENSLSPSNLAVYSKYNITVEKEGYYKEEFINISIFDGIESVQAVKLIPIGNDASENEKITINVNRLMNDDLTNKESGAIARYRDSLIIDEDSEFLTGDVGRENKEV